MHKYLHVCVHTIHTIQTSQYNKFSTLLYVDVDVGVRSKADRPHPRRNEKDTVLLSNKPVWKGEFSRHISSVNTADDRQRIRASITNCHICSGYHLVFVSFSFSMLIDFMSHPYDMYLNSYCVIHLISETPVTHLIKGPSKRFPSLFFSSALLFSFLVSCFLLFSPLLFFSIFILITYFTASFISPYLFAPFSHPKVSSPQCNL